MTRVTLVSKKFVTRVTLAFNMTSLCQINGKKERGIPHPTRARAGKLCQNRIINDLSVPLVPMPTPTGAWSFDSLTKRF